VAALSRKTESPKLVCAIVAGVQFMVDTAKCFIIEEGAQQLVMSGAPLVGTGENCINDKQPAGRTKSLGRQPLAEMARRRQTLHPYVPGLGQPWSQSQ
jgi:hypothetical protein